MKRWGRTVVALLAACSDGSPGPTPPPPPIGTLGLAAATYTVSETAPSVAITLRRAGGRSGQVSVSYRVSRGTATPLDDYEDAGSGVTTWPAGDDADRTVTVGIRNDALVEGDETFTIDLSDVTGGAALG